MCLRNHCNLEGLSQLIEWWQNSANSAYTWWLHRIRKMYSWSRWLKLSSMMETLFRMMSHLTIYWMQPKYWSSKGKKRCSRPLCNKSTHRDGRRVSYSSIVTETAIVWGHDLLIWWLVTVSGNGKLKTYNSYVGHAPSLHCVPFSKRWYIL